MLKRSGFTIFLNLVLFLLAIQGCSTESPVQERMVIDPHTVLFTALDSVKAVSITHTCTCPFSWTSQVLPVSPWLIVPADTSGDHADIPFRIDRSKLTADTAIAVVHIHSNSYGEDSVTVTVYRK